MRDYKKVCRCRDCGKIYDKGIPYICSKCGAEIGRPTPTILQMMGSGEVTLTEKCEKVVAKKGLFGWKVREPQYPEDIDYKVLEWLSRSACKGQPYSQEWRNRKYRKRMLDGINDYMDTNFAEDEMMEIYTYIGNACNHQRTIKFVESGYDLKVLKE